MRIVHIAALAAMFAAPAVPSMAAVDQSQGQSGVAQPLPDLGPAGNGRRLWVKFNCYFCHGSNGAGQFGPNVQHAGAGDVKEAVMQGVPEAGMPTYKKWVSPTDLTNLTAYLGSIGSQNEPVWWDWWIGHPKQ